MVAGWDEGGGGRGCGCIAGDADGATEAGVEVLAGLLMVGWVWTGGWDGGADTARLVEGGGGGGIPWLGSDSPSGLRRLVPRVVLSFKPIEVALRRIWCLFTLEMSTSSLRVPETSII